MELWENQNLVSETLVQLPPYTTPYIPLSDPSSLPRSIHSTQKISS